MIPVPSARHNDRAASFYRHLGFEFIKHAHGTGPQHYAADVGELVAATGGSR